jgi:hypothetical protein
MSYHPNLAQKEFHGPRIWKWTKQDFTDFGWFRILPLIDCEYVSRIVISLQLLFASLLLPAGLYVDHIMDYTCLPNDSILVLPLKSLARCVASTLPDCKLPKICTSNWQPIRKSSIISIYQPTWTSIFGWFLVHLLVNSIPRYHAHVGRAAPVPGNLGRKLGPTVGPFLTWAQKLVMACHGWPMAGPTKYVFFFNGPKSL